MSKDSTEYYVYVYIDPRNFEEFYYWKGKVARKNAHLKDETDTEKVRRIKQIEKEWLSPIIKVIAKDLTADQALLIEKTLIWKLGKSLTNISSGQYADNFRKHDTFHLDVSGFDFDNGLYLVNIGEWVHRCWADCREFGFLSAGQGVVYSKPMKSLEIWDIVIPYLAGSGYVGVGRVKEKAIKVDDFRYEGKTLNQFKLQRSAIFENSHNENSEYLVKIDWIVSVDKKDAKWIPNFGLFSTQLVKASLERQKKTIEFLEKEFSLNFKVLLWSIPQEE